MPYSARLAASSRASHRGLKGRFFFGGGLGGLGGLGFRARVFGFGFRV